MFKLCTIESTTMGSTLRTNRWPHKRVIVWLRVPSAIGFWTISRQCEAGSAAARLPPPPAVIAVSSHAGAMAIFGAQSTDQ